MQETHFICPADCRVLKDDYVVLSAYSNRSSVGVSLLIGRNLNADVNLVLTDVEGRLVVADVAVKGFEFRVAAVYAPNIAAESVSFFRWLAPFLDDPKRIVLVDDWNAILDPKIDRVGRGNGGSGRCESSRIDFMARHDLIDRFRLDQLGRVICGCGLIVRPQSVSALLTLWTEMSVKSYVTHVPLCRLIIGL